MRDFFSGQFVYLYGIAGFARLVRGHADARERRVPRRAIRDGTAVPRRGRTGAQQGGGAVGGGGVVAGLDGEVAGGGDRLAGLSRAVGDAGAEAVGQLDPDGAGVIDAHRCVPPVSLY